MTDMPTPQDRARAEAEAETPGGWTGGCFCGAVRYAVSPPGRFAQSCHCSRCRKAFSGAGSAIAFIAPDALRWTAGEALLTRYGPRPDEGLAFCSRCGSTLAGYHHGEAVCVTLGTLDGDPGIGIARHIFCASKASWDEIGGGAPRFAEGPD
ncbi:GFA family protein [Rhodovulum sp. DZ06]|uniref:GFA family protein n=1 Tax=Rhodovulum sp. DZ06 TaxID=3425126 RepID=UPI003D345FC1